MTKLLTYPEAAKLLGVSLVSLKRYAAAGVIPTIHFSKRMVKVPQDKLEAVIEAGGIDAYAKKGA
jgi:predicted site-specific integrase-resolvase